MPPVTVGVTLASSSPRRNQLLAILRIPFAVSPADVEEERCTKETPAEMVVRLSVAKARAATPQPGYEMVLGSDTAVTLGSGGEARVIGKPRDRDELRCMLEELGGREHVVYTGFALIDRRGGRTVTGYQTVRVRLRGLSGGEMAAYLRSGIGEDKAGAYAIQDQQFGLVESVSGCASAAMGLPLCALLRAFASLGLKVPPAGEVAAGCRALTGVECCLSLEKTCPPSVTYG